LAPFKGKVNYTYLPADTEAKLREVLSERERTRPFFRQSLTDGLVAGFELAAEAAGTPEEVLCAGAAPGPYLARQSP
jgi:hypothetical protein